MSRVARPARAQFLAGLLAVCCSLPAVAGPIEITDDRGAQVRLSRPAQRIVTLAPHLAELAWVAGAGASVVGVSAWSDQPFEAGALPVVADAAGIALERVLALHPDLALAWGSGTSPAAVRRLERLGVPVVVTEPARLHDIPRILRLIGRLADTVPTAERAAQAFEAGVADLRAAHAGHRSPRVFYQLWADPLMTVSGRHVIGDVLALCGGQNVFAELPGLTPTISREAVLAADPEVILAADSPPSLKAWHRFPQLGAVRSGALVTVRADLLQRATPRILDGAREVCERLDVVRRQTATTPNPGP